MLEPNFEKADGLGINDEVKHNKQRQRQKKNYDK